MLRWSIIQTLLYKEALRYRYNWGLLVMVFALLALTALVSISARLRRLPGQAPTTLRLCFVLYEPATSEEQWANYLKEHPPAREYPVSFRAKRTGVNPDRLPQETMAIELRGPSSGRNSGNVDVWEVRYCYLEDTGAATLPFREWLGRASQDFIGARPRLNEASEQVAALDNQAGNVPLIITALVIFALYLISFNLYITSTGEEREKKVLLGLMLSPASPGEIIAAKAIFYAVASLLVSTAVLCMYQPRLLAHPFLWPTLVSGSVGYVAIGTVILCIVRRQTTINTVSMLYLIVTSIIMFLSQSLRVFAGLKAILVENYLYAQLNWIISEHPRSRSRFNLAVLGVLVAVWVFFAVSRFAKQGMAISRAR